MYQTCLEIFTLRFGFLKVQLISILVDKVVKEYLVVMVTTGKHKYGMNIREMCER